MMQERFSVACSNSERGKRRKAERHPGEGSSRHSGILRDRLGETARVLALPFFLLLTTCDRTADEGAPLPSQAPSTVEPETPFSDPQEPKPKPNREQERDSVHSSDRSFEPVSYEELKRLSHSIAPSSEVQLDLHPYCEPPKQPPGRTSPIEPEGFPGLRMKDQDRLRELAEASPSFLGLVVDEKRRKVVLVFEPDFTKWRDIQERLTPSSGLSVELRPACHNSEQRKSALSLLNKFKAAQPSLVHGWAEEPSIGGFRVFVLPGDQAAADKVREQLGSIANVWFSRPFGPH